MATRKSEWLASIKPILDREGVKNDAKALAQELSDILDVKVGADAEGLEQLTTEFNQHLEKMGKQQIVFSEKTIQGIISQFANAVVAGMTNGITAASGQVDVAQIGNKIGGSISDGITEGIKDGLADVGRSITEQLDALQKRRHELHEQSKRLDKTYARYEKLADVSSMDYDEFKPLPLSANEGIDEQAYRVMDEFNQAEEALDAATRGTKEYNAALVKAMQSASNLYRMSHTLNDNKDLVKDKTLLSDYSFINLSDLTADVFDKSDVDFNKILRGFDKTYRDKIQAITSELAQLDAQIQSLQRENVDVVNQEKARAGLKTLEDIENAYDRISKKGQYAERAKDRIASAIEYEPGAESLAVLRNNYDKSLSSNEDWEVQYQWLVKFVKEYEAYSAQVEAETNGDKRRNMRQRQRRYTELYEELKPMATNAETSLREVLGMTGRQLPVRTHSNVGDASSDAANADKLAHAAEQKRLADEASAEANRVAAEEAEKRRLADKASARAIQEAAEKQKALTQQLDDSYDPDSYYDQDNLKFIQGERQKILQTLEQEGLMTDDIRVSQAKITDEIQHRIDVMKARNDAELTLNELDGIGGENIEDPDEMREIIAKRQTMIGSISEMAFEDGDPYQLSEDVEKAKQYNAQLEKRVLLLEDVKRGLISIDDVDDMMAESGSLESKLDRLGEVANSWASKVKDSEIDEDDDALESLQQFEETYDRIILKLANGRNIEILPNAKGLRALYKYYDGIDSGSYGESEIEDVYFERIKKEVVSTEQAVDGLNESLEKTQQLTSGSGVGDASLADLESERAKSEALQDELDNRIGALQAAHDEKEMLQSDLNVANEQIKIAQDSEMAARARADETDLKLIEKDKQIQDLEERLAQAQTDDGDALFTAEQRANEAEEKAAMYDRAMTSMQEEMADLRGKLADAKTGGSEGSSASLEDLKNVLSAIVYNVKIAHDDNDKQANKIALDDSTLEATLTKVFANILRPDTSQDTPEQQQEHWALESTLQTVKGALDNIYTNTAKIGIVQLPNVDTITGTALDGRLTEIKSVLESINSKITKGGVIVTRGAVKQASAQPIESEARAQAARSNMMKSLINDYKTMGKLSAQLARDNNLETKATLDNLKEEIARKRQSLKISMDENKNLREKYSIAFDAEKRLLDAAKAQKEINARTKTDAKEAETAWKKQVKDAQRATGINAATTAANAGDQTVVRAIGAEGVSKDIENKAKELSDNIKTLRMLRDEIDKKGTQASDGDRDNLSKQIAKVKELKTEVDSYLKIHEKYSGEGVTDLGDASNFGAVGTDQYWNNITAAIKNASNGKVVINSLNADTGELTGTTKIAANTFAQWSATVDPLTGRLSMLRTGIKKTETVIEQIKRKTKEIFTYFSGSSIIFKAVNELKKGVQYVRDIDLALTELKKVTDETEETYRKFLDTASKTAAKVGSTIKDVVSSTADWARLGYSMKEAAQFAETTQILMNVSEFTDVSQATDTLISSVQAFGYTAETSMEVVDLLNTIGEIIAYR